jgi:hypothetical protein
MPKSASIAATPRAGAARHNAAAAASASPPRVRDLLGGESDRLGDFVLTFQSDDDAVVDATVFTHREEDAAEPADAIPAVVALLDAIAKQAEAAGADAAYYQDQAQHVEQAAPLADYYSWLAEEEVAVEEYPLPAATAAAASDDLAEAEDAAGANLDQLAEEWVRLIDQKAGPGGDDDEAAQQMQQLKMQLELEMRQHFETTQAQQLWKARVVELQRKMQHVHLVQRLKQLERERRAAVDPGLTASVALPAEMLAPAPAQLQDDDDSTLTLAAGMRSATPSGLLSHSIRASSLWGGGAGEDSVFDGEQQAGGYGVAEVDLDEFANAVVYDLNTLLVAIRLAACQGVLLAAVMVLYIWVSSSLEKRLERLEAAAAAAAAAAGKVADAV